MSMNKRIIHRFILGVSFSLILWSLVDNFLITIPIWKWIIIEILFGIWDYLCTFVKLSLGLEEADSNDDN